MKIFDEALARAIKDIQNEAAEQGAETDEDELRAVAEREWESRLSRSAFARDYRQTALRIPPGAADAPVRAVLRGIDLLVCLSATVATCLLYGWTVTRQDFLPSGGSLLLNATTALAGLLAAGGIAFGIGWALTPVPGGPASRRPPDEAYVAMAAVIGGIVTPGLTVLVSVACDSGVAGVPALLLSAAAWTFALTPGNRSWWLAYARLGTLARDRERLARLQEEWLRELTRDITEQLRPTIEAAAERAHAIRMSIRATASLKRVRSKSLHVGTPAERSLIVAGKGMDDGSIALSGPRGVGKTELLTTFCDDPTRVGVVVVAPVNYDRREFVLHLFAEVCKRMAKDGPRSLRRQAGRQLRQIWYLQSHNVDASLGVPAVGFKLGRTRSRQPLTYPEIVHEFKRFLTGVSRGLGNGSRLVIGIDELDRIHPSSEAQTFFNEIKVIFDVPGCLFVLSVSDEALRAAELAPVGGRDVFDSAIDEVVRVEPLDQEDARRLLAARVIGLPVGFTALFNALAGGIPRNLLRIARAAILFADHDADHAADHTAGHAAIDGSGQRTVQEDLGATTARLVERELKRIAGNMSAELPPEASALIRSEVTRGCDTLTDLSEQVAQVSPAIGNRLFFLDTVLGFFTALKTPELIKQAEKDGTFTCLARAGALIGNADGEARKALERIREWPGLDQGPTS
jgi:hypothetical protein